MCIRDRHRSKLIPNFHEVKSAALNSRALGCSISGSGPSIFALSQGIDTAEAVGESMKKVYNETEIEFSTYVSKINDKGVKII